ncbi:Sulfotransferase family protein [Paracoccus isoporae]|uniref:Sulfotransferase family protein n=1 Tax=Paracoccus isoporae TaxID=591205 RepID=A0A1G6XIR5_9RHOB|nr:sulfotransferase [Paracoccus isoporae]SDD77096.1 Sulfotransferase family protein [Paracoccus isoporae]
MTPIFILGLQRSGTTWLANMLAGSGAVAAVTAEEHRGVHESVFFSHFARAFGRFADPGARARFRTAFEASDYFLLTGLETCILDDAIRRSVNYGGVFRAVMDEFARRRGCAHWLEKSPHHSLLAEELAARFPDARFLCVTRDSRSLIASRLAAYGREPRRGWRRVADIIRGTAANRLHQDALRRFAAGRQNALLIRYEEMLSDAQGSRDRLVRFLDLDVTPEALDSAFAPNSSHAGRSGTRTLSRVDHGLIRGADAASRVLPTAALRRVADRRRAARGADWPDWVWLKTGYRPD